jgi:lysophospholipase L1-like esterase
MRRAIRLIGSTPPWLARLAVALVCSCGWATSPTAAAPRAANLPLKEGQIKIMPLGDSITDGFNVPGGYRVELRRRLLADGFDIDFVGSMSNGPDSLVDKNHEGHIGWSTVLISNSVNWWLDAYQPDVILLMIGTNDMIIDSLYESAPDHLSALIDQISDRLPNARLVVASITLMKMDEWSRRALVYNAAIPDMVRLKASEGRNVSFVNMNGALDAGDISDSVHPTAAGYDKMANAWYGALIPLLNNAPPKVSVTSPADNSSFNAPPVVTLEASASDADGSVSKVEFFDGGVKLGEVTASPYRFAWDTQKATAGIHSLTVRVTDDAGTKTSSSPIKVTIIKHAIGGRVVDERGAGVGGVTVSLTCARSQTATTDAQGSYTFEGLAGGVSYTVTPSPNPLFTFTPKSQTFDSLDADRSVNFVRAAATYIISGRVAGGGQSLGGIAVTLGGSLAAVTTTDAGGVYHFSVTAGGDYTVTPAQTPLYSFGSRSLTNVVGDQTLNFDGALRAYSVRGRVSGGGIPLGGVTISLAGAQTRTTKTDDGGSYSFTDLPAAGSYTVTPDSTALYAFTSRSLAGLAADQQFDFNGALLAYSIRGRVNGGGGLAGMTVLLSGSLNRSALTDANGNYAFTNLDAGGNYTVTVIDTPYFTFTPQTVQNLSGDQTFDLGGSPKLYTLGGRVSVGGEGLAGATITLAGAESRATTTDAGGSYEFAGLTAGGDFTVTAAKARYVLAPPSRAVHSLDANQTADFAASLAPNVPVLLSQAGSTRAVALDALTFMRDPFPPDSAILWGDSRRTRVMLFVANIEPSPAVGAAAFTADAEDSAHRLYPLAVEYAGAVPQFGWLTCVVVRLDDAMGDAGDVLVRISFRGVPGNRVRIGVGHTGGGLPDDPLLTQAREPRTIGALQ